MHARSIAVVVIAAALAVYVTPVDAQPPEDEIEMEPDPVPAGSGSGSAAPPTGDPPAPPVQDPKLAKKLAAAALQAMQKGDYLARMKKPDEAKTQYEAAAIGYQGAIDAGGDINLYFDLGIVEDKLGKTDVAAKHWRTVMKGAAKPDVVKKATAKFDDAATKLGLVTLVVKPEGATISLAGAAVGTSPLAEPLILMPGTYSFQLTADGFQSKATEITVEAGSEAERTIELEPVKIIIEKPVLDPEPIDRAVITAPSKLPLYLGGGAVLALGVTATITGILAVGEHGTFTAGDSSAGERRDAQDSGKRLALVSDLTLVGGLAAGGFTAYWYFFKYKPAQRKLATEQGPKVTVVPWVQPATNEGGVTILGRF